MGYYPHPSVSLTLTAGRDCARMFGAVLVPGYETVGQLFRLREGVAFFCRPFPAEPTGGATQPFCRIFRPVAAVRTTRFSPDRIPESL